jgi:ubiquinone/menaquinone biosynthesis C-methylase UbiE
MNQTRYSEKITGLIWRAIEKLFNVVAKADPTPNATLQLFIELMSKKEGAAVLETGTKRSMPDRSTLHKEWVPHAGEYLGTDFQKGADVDVVADLHHLSRAFDENRFDAVISCSTLEHVQYPWIAAIEICRVLKPGGLVFIQTHQTYPLHAYPFDYWRFSTEALQTLFCEKIGFKTLHSSYEFPAHIFSNRVPSTKHDPSYLNVLLLAQKIHHPASQIEWAP